MLVILDAAVCMLWILTYVFVLIGTIKYRYPLISPISQLFFGTNEFAVLLFFIGNASNFNEYVIITYLVWALLEVAIFIAVIKIKGIKKMKLALYLTSIMVITVIVYFLIAQGWLMFINYFNALCGVIFWLVYACRKDYPFTWIGFASFVAKALADVTAIFVNLGQAGWVTLVVGLILPLVDIIFIFIFIFRCKNQRRISDK